MNTTVTGRFAPSPTGRMHLGNLFAALFSWLDARAGSGRWLLRHEDLDPGRSRPEWARQIEDDLRWLGLEWDAAPQYQSRRHALYESALDTLVRTGWVYPCRCTRRDIMATQAPHQSDGRVIYPGRCRPQSLPSVPAISEGAAMRLAVPDCDIVFTDGVYGLQKVNLARECGDFVLRRADGAWAYQLAVVADDADMGVTRVTRGSDLLLSAAQQIYLYGLLGHESPEFVHVPLLCNARGVRLSKRDNGLDAGALRERYTREELLGLLAHLGGQTDRPGFIALSDLLRLYRREAIPKALDIKL